MPGARRCAKLTRPSPRPEPGEACNTTRPGTSPGAVRCRTNGNPQEGFCCRDDEPYYDPELRVCFEVCGAGRPRTCDMGKDFRSCCAPTDFCVQGVGCVPRGHKRGGSLHPYDWARLAVRAGPPVLVALVAAVWCCLHFGRHRRSSRAGAGGAPPGAGDAAPLLDASTGGAPEGADAEEPRLAR